LCICLCGVVWWCVLWYITLVCCFHKRDTYPHAHIQSTQSTGWDVYIPHTRACGQADLACVCVLCVRERDVQRSVWKSNIKKRKDAHTHTHTYKYTHIHTHTPIHTHIYTKKERTPPHTHTHTILHWLIEKVYNPGSKLTRDSTPS